MKKSNTLYYIGGAILLYILYNKYYKNPGQTPVITNTLSKESQSTTPAQQTAEVIAPKESLVDSANKTIDSTYNVKYAISGSRNLKGLPSII